MYSTLPTLLKLKAATSSSWNPARSVNPVRDPPSMRVAALYDEACPTLRLHCAYNFDCAYAWITGAAPAGCAR